MAVGKDFNYRLVWRRRRSTAPRSRKSCRPDASSLISDLHTPSRPEKENEEIVKHLQAIKRVNYDRDIEPDTRVNRTRRSKYFDVSFGRKNIFYDCSGAIFFLLPCSWPRSMRSAFSFFLRVPMTCEL